MGDALDRMKSITPAQKALLLGKLGRVSSSVVNAPKPMPRNEGAIPLSFAQSRLWLLDRLSPGSSAYNMPYVLELSGSLDLHAFARALSQVIARHEILRTVFPVDPNGLPFQEVLKFENLDILQVIDLQDLGESSAREEARKRVDEIIGQGFDLSKGLLLRISLFKLAPERFVFVFVCHHIIFDGWSISLLNREVSSIYNSLVGGALQNLPTLPIQYADFAIWQREWSASNECKKQLDYWKSKLSGDFPPLQLDTDRPRPSSFSHQGNHRSLVLSSDLTVALKDLSRECGATLFMTMLAAWKILLARHSGQFDIAVGTPIANRNYQEIEKLIGVFLNNLILRTDLSGNPTFKELIRRVRQESLDAYSNQTVPFEYLIEAIKPERSLSYNPLFQVYFNYVDSVIGGGLDLVGVNASVLDFSIVSSKFDLTLYVSIENDCINVNAVYASDLFLEETIAEWLAQYEFILRQVSRDGNVKIENISILTLQAKKVLPNPMDSLLPVWNGSVQDWFAGNAKRKPNDIAVIDGDRSWKYSEIDELSNQLAHALISGGLNFQDCVAIYAHRNVSLVIGLLGILKAGGVFVVLDPAYPANRLLACLEIAKPKAFLHLNEAGIVPDVLIEFLERLGCKNFLHLPPVDGIVDFLKSYSSGLPPVQVGPNDFAYVAFTSGSTGQPKGILGKTHISHIASWVRDTFPIGAGDRFTVLSGLSHDPLHRDIFLPLQLGATVCIPSVDDLSSPDRLFKWMRSSAITISNLTPAMGQFLVQRGGDCADLSLEQLRFVFFVGDILTQNDVQMLKRFAPFVSCVNLYGATETQRAVSYFVCDEYWADESKSLVSNKERKQIIPVGRGISGVQVLVMGPGMRLAGIGEIGEIYFRSPYLAHGYLGDDGLTREKFIDNPFTHERGDRLYRTGDLGRYRSDGVLETLGRSDLQVKIRGFRIELGEIESILNQHESIRDAVVIAREDGAGNKRLIAYVVPKEHQEIEVLELSAFLKKSLPEYMVPSHFVKLEALPVTPNGKVDRKALPAPELTAKDDGNVFVPPLDLIELKLANLWERILGVGPIGLKQDFFALGGHSLLAVKLLSEINKEFGQDLSLPLIFQASTLEQQVAVLRGKVTLKWKPIHQVQAGGTLPPIFYIPTPVQINLSQGRLAYHLGPDFPFYTLHLLDIDGDSSQFKNFDECVSFALKSIVAQRPRGPYILGGFCAGGTIAYEVARRLEKRGESVPLIFMWQNNNLMNPNKPLKADEDPIPWIRHVMAIVSGAYAKAEDVLSREPQKDYNAIVDDLIGETPDIETGFAKLLDVALKNPHAWLGKNVTMERLRRIMDLYIKLVLGTSIYRPKPVLGKTLFFRTSYELRFNSSDYLSSGGWKNLNAKSENVMVHDFWTCNSGQIFESPYVEKTAKLIKDSLSKT